MNKFISEMCATMGIENTQSLNCCACTGTLIDDASVSFKMTLPGGIVLEVYTKSPDSGPAEMGYAYLPDFDQESPDMCAEDLGVWADNRINCCKRVDAFFDRLKSGTNLNSSIDLNSGADRFTDEAMPPELNERCKNVFEAAISGVDVGQNFRYQAPRTSIDGEYILRTLQVYSPKIGQWYWICKSGLRLSESFDAADEDDWGFIPNWNPQSEGHLVYHQANRFVAMDSGLYGETVTGETPEKRDRMAAYWLVGILSDMFDSILQNPPVRVYEYFLSQGIAGFSKDTVMQMAPAGIIRCIQKGYLDAEKVLKARPDLARQLVEKKLLPPEVVARRSPNDLLWLVTKGLVSPDYAVKLNPDIKDKLAKKGLYSVAEGVPDDPTAILEAVKAGSITPVDAYRKNPKTLQTMVEQQLITPQEAYKLDASIVTWLLINHYIGKEEALRVKPDVQKYIARKYKDVDWDSLDASASSGLNSSRTETRRRDRARTLNASMRLNSSEPTGFTTVGKTAASGQIAASGDFGGYGPGYERLADTAVQGPGYVAEVMLPEDDFDGIVVPGASAEVARETLNQMLLANDGTFVDWQEVPCIQTFKSENPDGNFLVLN